MAIINLSTVLLVLSIFTFFAPLFSFVFISLFLFFVFIDFMPKKWYNKYMEQKRLFTKNDESFVCKNCGAEVPKLGKTSRDHCPKCLFSLHVDIMPGDRANSCRGLMKPTAIEWNAKKNTYTIVYKCTKCGEIHRNKMADDDDFEKILEISKQNGVF